MSTNSMDEQLTCSPLIARRLHCKKAAGTDEEGYCTLTQHALDEIRERGKTIPKEIISKSQHVQIVWFLTSISTSPVP